MSNDHPQISPPAEEPYIGYRWLRDQSPVLWDDDWGSWAVTGYAEAAFVLRDGRFSADRFSVSEGIPEVLWTDMHRVNALLARQMVFRDPPGHTRLRRLVTEAFTPRRIERLRDRIQEVADTLLDRVAASGRIEIISEFAHLLPVTVIAEMLGVPTQDHARFRKWADDFFNVLDGQTAPEQQRALLQSAWELTDYFENLIALRRQAPTDDLLSALVSARDQGDRLTDQELIANSLLLLSAGHETTTNLIGSGLLCLLRYPDQEARLRQDTSLMPTAIEEMLRYESPVQWTGRQAKEDVELSGQIIRGGQMVSLCLGAANRDPLAFSDPERFDVGRSENKHLAFGYGPHFCLGAALARLEGQVAFETLLCRFSAIRLEIPNVEWRSLSGFRALKALPVVLES